jgi:hypothetical protein
MTTSDMVSFELGRSMTLPPISFEGFLPQNANTPSATASLHQDSWDAAEHHSSEGGVAAENINGWCQLSCNGPSSMIETVLRRET